MVIRTKGLLAQASNSIKGSAAKMKKSGGFVSKEQWYG